MRIEYCDLCGQEIKKRNVGDGIRKVTVETRFSVVGEKRFEVCDECSSKIVDFIDSLRDEEQLRCVNKRRKNEKAG